MKCIICDRHILPGEGYGKTPDGNFCHWYGLSSSTGSRDDDDECRLADAAYVEIYT